MTLQASIVLLGLLILGLVVRDGLKLLRHARHAPNLNHADPADAPAFDGDQAMENSAANVQEADLPPEPLEPPHPEPVSRLHASDAVHQVACQALCADAPFTLYATWAPGEPAVIEALVDGLREAGAVFDERMQAFHAVNSEQTYLFSVANAFQPGTLPNLFAPTLQPDDLRGVALLVPRASLGNSLESIEGAIRLGQRTASAGATLRDSDSNPATAQTFAYLRSEAGEALRQQFARSRAS